ncbi:MAG: energy transducer TonB [Mangrovibacterium sp.]
MRGLKKLYHENIYGIIGTLLFHVLLLGAILLAQVRVEGEIKEEEIIIDFSQANKEPEEEKPEEEKPEDENEPSAEESIKTRNTRSNRAVNDAAKKDPFFDESYQQEVAAAKKLVTDVNKQLSKERPELKPFDMPEQNTEGMDPEKISNTIYSGESNIHYDLKDRFHVRLPIPVYLAKGGGKITVDIWVSPSGKVTKASVRQQNQLTDPLLPEYALQAALRTVFNSKPDAPNPQKGTIAYTFVAQ